MAPRLPAGLVAVVFALAGCASVPTEYVAPPPLAMNERAALNARVFTAAWEVVNEKYFDPKFKGVDWPAMRTKYAPAAAAAADDDALYRVIGEMVGELRDKHVFAISPRRVHEGRAQHLPETGLRLRRMGDAWIVTDLVPGSPAEVAGVKRGWRIVARNGRPLPDEDRRDDFFARVGDAIRYTFSDEREQPREMEIMPEFIPFDSTRFVSRELAGGIRYLRFDHFDPSVSWWFVGEMKSHRDAPGVIIDLRNNPGGQIRSLQRAVGQFFRIVVSWDRR